MNSHTIRKKFLDFFVARGHQLVPSSPVLPYDDPTLLFNNAGMNQFKDVFLGKGDREYSRATSSQKCIRVGGKHNDLENVGHTKRHLTFFEMLGNFSFGDYFKKEAIAFAWELSTTQWGIDGDRIWPSVYKEDEEAYELWKAFVPEERICRLGAEENYWSMGESGPCGPCSELLFDRGKEFGEAKSPYEDSSGERFLEFWNLVFMESSRDEKGSLSPLPKKNIDTGGGLERIASLLQGTDSVFETDLLRQLIGGVERVSGKKYAAKVELKPAFHVVADHLRCLSFAIADGVAPSNIDRGYVLRKILRRAVRYGKQLGLNQPFFAELVDDLVLCMGDHFGELKTHQERIKTLLTNEEEAFFATLRRGGNLMNRVIEKAQTRGQISGKDAFTLKDTYGLPWEEILLLAQDADLTVDEKEYRACEEQAKELSRRAHKKTAQVASANILEKQPAATFVGYESEQTTGRVEAIVVDDQLVEKLQEGQEGIILLDTTPFYAEKGGQVGDQGVLLQQNALFLVEDCQSPKGGVICHIGRMQQGEISLGDSLQAIVDHKRRQGIRAHHTATHLLHWALHKVLGEHATQAGSVVEERRLRFDFNHQKGLSLEEIEKVEDLVNQHIIENRTVRTAEMAYAEAQRQKEIKQFFGDKYGKQVRVVGIGDFSKELCGGTHVSSTGSIGPFRIIKEGSIASGVRRIEAVCGAPALQHSRKAEEMVRTLSTLLKTKPEKLPERIEKLLSEQKSLQKEIAELCEEKRTELLQQLLKGKQESAGVSLVAAKAPLPIKQLKLAAEELLQMLGEGVVVLGSEEEGRCGVVVTVSQGVTGRGVLAKELIAKIATAIEGRGGGKAQMAQAGSEHPEKLQQALSSIAGWLNVS